MNLTVLKQKLILGTVQLGLSYGINNQSGKPNETVVEQILNKAAAEGINLLDSAEQYGDSLLTIGNYIRKHSTSSFEVISKFIDDGVPLVSKVAKSLTALRRDYLYGYLFHRFADYHSPEIRKELVALKEKGRIQHWGVSLYSTEELRICVRDPDLTIIQLPYNLLDASQEKLDLMAEARAVGKKIHVRSVFLQGLFFKDEKELTGNLREFSPVIRRLQAYSTTSGASIREICLNFALHQPEIDHVIIGVETAEQLSQNIAAIAPEITRSWPRDLNLPPVDMALLNPSTWKP